MRIKAYRSPDRRLRTETFKSAEGTVFCIAEPMAWGTLVSRFKESGEIVDRVENERTRNATSALEMYFAGSATMEVLEAGSFEHVRAQAACAACGGTKVERELDSQRTDEMQEVPVIPVFVCTDCGSRFCLISDDYVKNMISKYSRYIALKKSQDAESTAFISSVKDNIIRSFASQNIKRLEIKATA